MTAPRRLSILDVARVAWQAGFRGEALVRAVAIAMAESGGNVGARCVYCITNPATGQPYPDHSHGLWQINILAHPQYDERQLEADPLYNAKAAFAVSGGGATFRPWSTRDTADTGTVRKVLGAVFARNDAEQLLNQPVPGTMPNPRLPAPGGGTSTAPTTGSGGDGATVVQAGFNILGPIGSLAESIFGVFGGVLEDGSKALLGGVANLAITGVLVAGGVALAVAGLYRVAVGTRTGQAVQQGVKDVAGTAIGAAGAAL
jgi:hypothetical protein